MHSVVFGAGFSGMHIARHLSEWGSVCGTRRGESGLRELDDAGIPGCQVDGVITDALLDTLSRMTHLVVSVAPRREPPLLDPLLHLLAKLPQSAMPNLRWIGYLSTIGVYGNHEGGWVNEQTPCTSTQPRSQMRREAELAWQSFADDLHCPLSILRLSGIYGPGRNAVLDALNGKARMLIKSGQVFNRIHVHDLATATALAARKCHNGILNITDDTPAPPQDVVRYAHRLVGKEPPAPLAFETADISPMARSFYSENKRVANQASKDVLQLQYDYPDYQAGLSAEWEALNNSIGD